MAGDRVDVVTIRERFGLGSWVDWAQSEHRAVASAGADGGSYCGGGRGTTRVCQSAAYTRGDSCKCRLPRDSRNSDTVGALHLLSARACCGWLFRGLCWLFRVRVVRVIRVIGILGVTAWRGSWRGSRWRRNGRESTTSTSETTADDGNNASSIVIIVFAFITTTSVTNPEGWRHNGWISVLISRGGARLNSRPSNSYTSLVTRTHS